MNDRIYSTVCVRCLESECICGTAEFESFVEEELASQRNDIRRVGYVKYPTSRTYRRNRFGASQTE
jgi:hypothetical protein